ncbi:MAG: sll0787 family AIR synthase-like protein [Cyanobacteria bacterium J06626_14]
MLNHLVTELRQALGLLYKQDIQVAAQALGQEVQCSVLQRQAIAQSEAAIRLGDDCAAIPDGDSFLLLAAEGMWPLLVETEPWFAGWCSVLVNVSDIYAMGGHPVAVVDALWSASPEISQELWNGMVAASKAFDVPIVGGHTNGHSPYHALSVAILGRATHLITSFDARPGDVLVLATDFRGKAHSTHPFWDAATEADPKQLQRNLAILPDLAKSGLCRAGKDISMGGIIGTTLMLLESSGCGAVLTVDQIPVPSGISLQKWLLSFPSYGFLLSIHPGHVETVQNRFIANDLICEVIGHIQPGSELTLTNGIETEVFWNLTNKPLTGFSPSIA